MLINTVTKKIAENLGKRHRLENNIVRNIIEPFFLT